MKIQTYFLATVLAILLSFAAFAAETAKVSPESGAAPPDTGLKVDTPAPSPHTVTAVERVDATFEVHQAWVKESVGVSPLSIYRVAFAAIKEHPGYRSVEFLPDITIGYKLTGAMHRQYASTLAAKPIDLDLASIDTAIDRPRAKSGGFTGLAGNHYARAGV